MSRADAEIKNDDGHDDDDKKKKFGVLFIIGAHVLPSAYNIHNWREERAYRDIVDVAAFLLAQHNTKSIDVDVNATVPPPSGWRDQTAL
ncbi:hypothetical protein OUZ56_030673 [Daphnia magna]|uniref:Uncharacterized protein n=1 Tax=Daphnia magna TaxID=35525 RepID=A0ABQ9ZTA0_9CRUS|nr:hypothetical protein OUZ56_030673 [Daphnia magna]